MDPTYVDSEQIIAREGDDQITSWYVLQPGSLKFEDDMVYPLTWNFDNRKKIGDVTNVRRDEETGHIMATVRVTDPQAMSLQLEDNDQIGFYAQSDDVTMVPREPGEVAKEVKRIVESTTLRSVGCVPNPGNPGAKI